MPCRRYTVSTSFSWAGPLGAVRPLLAPSWLTPVARMTPRMSSPAASASASRLSTSTATPSANTVPLAELSKVRHSPDGESTPMSASRFSELWSRPTLAPPASAIPQSPASRLRQAMWIATTDEEQAVLTISAGPCQSRK